MIWIRHLSAQWLATGYVAAVSMALTFGLGRTLGPAGFGEYSYLLTLAALLGIFQDGGFRTLLMRERAAASAHLERAGSLFSRAIGHALAVTLGLWALVWALPFADPVGLSAAVGCLLTGVVAQFVSAHLKGAGRFGREAVWQIASRTLTAVAVGLVLLTPQASPLVVFRAWMLGGILALLLPAVRPLVWRWPRFAFDPAIYRACLAFVAIDFATAIYFRIDVVMLRELTGDEAEVGCYSAAYRLLEAVIFLFTPIAHIAFRHLRIRWQQRNDFNRLLVMLVLAMLAAALSIVGVAYLAAPWIVGLTFGAEYQNAEILLPWLMAALLFVLPNYILTQGAIALNQELYYAVIAFVAALLNVLLNYCLIPGHGGLGAAWATLVTEATLGFLLVLLLGKKPKAPIYKAFHD